MRRGCANTTLSVADAVTTRTTAKVRFLYIDSSKDSSKEMMNLDDPTWRTLGKSVQLDKRSQLLITGSDLNQILASLDNYTSRGEELRFCKKLKA